MHFLHANKYSHWAKLLSCQLRVQTINFILAIERLHSLLVWWPEHIGNTHSQTKTHK